jgi:predicted transcriptional regulator
MDHKETVSITVRIPSDVKALIDILAEIERRSINNEIVIALENYIEMMKNTTDLELKTTL